TELLPPVVGASAALNLALNLLLIPRIGMIGAAWATLAAYSAMTSTLFLWARKLYLVPYDFLRAGGLVSVAGGTFLLASLFPSVLRWGVVLIGYPILAFGLVRPRLRG
ncbi:MAG TPA: hypothetical protein EYP61_10420, partial [Candidatus Latescibacteria bacterium]|nr:hypothetical protein [Candidatus Latescibacterota bacterium]